MKKHFRKSLFLTMIIFALFLSFLIAAVDQQRLKEQAVQNNSVQIRQTEDMVRSSLQSLEKAYFLFEEETAANMKENTEFLIEKYEDMPFEDWDFPKLKEQLGMDIYILNSDKVIIHSSFEEDVGMDFTDCCQKLAKVLEERRKSGAFFHDGMDIEQETGGIKKYSYMATPDKKYIIELGYSLEDSRAFKEFNFLEVSSELVRRYDSIHDINVLNLGGYSLGQPVEETKLSKERREAFEHTLTTKEPTEVQGTWEGNPVVYRYSHYVSNLDLGTTRNKVLEIVYNDDQLQAVLAENRKDFFITLIIVVVLAIAIASLISHWVSKPMYLAFHDSLTGLKNRAAFEDVLRMNLRKNNVPTSLIMIDLDNFKTVNDTLGHDKGDQLLETIARHIDASIRKGDTPFRMGGDEFVIIMPRTSRQEAEQAASRILSLIRTAIESDRKVNSTSVTASAGIAVTQETSDDPAALYKQADIALYASKEKGKNQYHVYEGNAYAEHELG